MKTEEYYKYLKDENYKALLNSEMQLDSARQRAMKNSQTQLAAQGMASSGYGSTMQTGLEGQYLQGLQNAQQAYQENQTNLNIQEQNAIQQDMANKYSSLSQLMGSAQSRDELNNLLSTQGYGQYRNGQFIWNQDALSKLGEDNALNLQSLYGMYGSQLDKVNNDVTNANFNSLISQFAQAEFSSEEEMNKWIDTFIDRSKMTEEQQKYFDYYLNGKKQGFTQANNVIEPHTIGTNVNGQQVTSNYSGTTGKSFSITIGDTSQTVGLGSKADDQSQGANHNVGDIWVQVEDTGSQPNLYLVIKTSSGAVKYINTDTDYLDRGDQLQFYADMLQALGYNVRLDGDYWIWINGVRYEYDRSGTDSLEESPA